MDAPQHFLFALVEDFTHLAFSCAIEPLRIASLVTGREVYRWSFASLDGQIATCSNAITTSVHHQFENLPSCDRLFVLSGINVERKDTKTLVAALRRARARGTQIGALCSGAYILAKAGLLDGTRATIHWQYHDCFAEEFPDVQLVRNVYVADQKFITASGGTATGDLMLHLITTDLGRDTANAVADQMLYGAMRNGDSTQRAALPSTPRVRNRHLLKAIEIMRDRIEDPISPSVLAVRLGISTRQVERLFVHHLKVSPKRYLMAMRMERARHLLQHSDAAIAEIAIACGFSNFGHFSRVYRSAYGVTPNAQRSCEVA